MKATFWNKKIPTNQNECTKLIKFCQFKRLSKTKKIQFIAICSDRIQYFYDSDYTQLHGETLFTFSLTVEWIYSEQKMMTKKLPKLVGFKLRKGDDCQSFYLSDEVLLDEIYQFLNRTLMQRNIHHYYKLIRKLGKGGFGSVYLLLNKFEHKFYAAKVFVKQKNRAKENRISIEKEISTLRMLDHNNLINLKETFITDNSIYLITDYCSGPSLESFLIQKTQEFTKDEIINYMKQLLSGINYFHSKGIMHRDIKPGNILFRSIDCNELVLIDFGLAQEVNSNKYLYPRAGTPGYVAPEIANNNQKLSNYNELCDIFSLGCVMYFVVTGQCLFEGQNQSEIFEANKKCQIELDSEKYNSMDLDIKKILQLMLAKNPQDRKSAKEILQMKIFEQPNNNISDNYNEEIPVQSNNSFDYFTSDTSSQNSNDILTKLEMFSEMQGNQIIIDYIKEDNFEDQEPTQLTNSSKQLLQAVQWNYNCKNNNESIFKKNKEQEMH